MLHTTFTIQVLIAKEVLGPPGPHSGYQHRLQNPPRPDPDPQAAPGMPQVSIPCPRQTGEPMRLNPNPEALMDSDMPGKLLDS